MSRAYLGLGTNMGDRLDYLNKACDLLEQNENVLSLKKSNLYETKAWGYTDQADFLNMCRNRNKFSSIRPSKHLSRHRK